MTESLPPGLSLLAKLGTEQWQLVDTGESSADTLRSASGDRYAKCVRASGIPALQLERDKNDWLRTTGIPGPEVLDWLVTDDGACLVTSAVPGVTADQVSAATLARAWESISTTVRRLHDLPLDSCPFSRDLAQMFLAAQNVVARGAVNPDFLPEEQLETAPEELLARLEPQRELRLQQEAAEAVVCHGDLCLPNIVLDPATWEVAGFIDLGRLGVADPYADISLLLANARELWTDEPEAAEFDQMFAKFYDTHLDSERQEFYLHLDPLTWG